MPTPMPTLSTSIRVLPGSGVLVTWMSWRVRIQVLHSASTIPGCTLSGLATRNSARGTIAQPHATQDALMLRRPGFITPCVIHSLPHMCRMCRSSQATLRAAVQAESCTEFGWRTSSRCTFSMRHRSESHLRQALSFIKFSIASKGYVEICEWAYYHRSSTDINQLFSHIPRQN